MVRVAKRALSITEPAQAAVTQAAVRLGIALEREEAGNRVARIAPQEIARRLEDGGLRVIGVQRYTMFYRHVPGAVVRTLSVRPLAALAQVGYRLANLLVGRFGNKVAIRAVRVPEPGVRTTR